MVKTLDIEPSKTELPVDYADRMGVLYASDIRQAEKESAGQFFTSGNYFRIFREYFFSNIQIKQIHLFVSRKDTFSRDNAGTAYSKRC